MKPSPPLRVATRGSEQARAQAGHVAGRLGAVTGRAVELVLVETAGDRLRDRPIGEIGGQGVFTKEVQHAVLDGRADVAVHSAKDLPSSWITEGLVLACVPERADPRDALAGAALADLGDGATVATGSARRRTQLANLLTYMDGKSGAEKLMNQVLNDPALLQALASAPKPADGGSSEEPSNG